MKVIIKATSEVKALSIINPKTDEELVLTVMNGADALSDGRFQLTDDGQAYVCDQATFDWWNEALTVQQSLLVRLYYLYETIDPEVVGAVMYMAVSGIDRKDLIATAKAANQALDVAFGSTKRTLS